MQLEKLNNILQEALVGISECQTSEDIANIRNKYLSKKSELMSIMSSLGGLSIEEKKELGQKLNYVKGEISKALELKAKEIETKELNEKLEKETIDFSLPSVDFSSGSKNPFFIIRDEIIDIFLGMGYSLADGPEVEKDLYNFELLNIPKDHPARDMQDSFYINDSLLLRTHTSPVQARVMEKSEGKPIRIICPGKTYRRDDDDATHSHQFAQIEGLLIDKDINIGHLKATLELFLRKMFGEKREVRLVPSFFPFTEPSVEVNISCANCGGKGCPICKDTGWIEILGGGMVHPNV